MAQFVQKQKSSRFFRDFIVLGICNFGKRVTWTACRDCFDGHLPVKKPPIVSDPQLSPPGAKKKILFYRLSTLKKLHCVCCGSLPLVRHKKGIPNM